MSDHLIDASKGALLLDRVRAFMVKQDITCAETIYQTDRVIENAQDFIEELCEIVGYPSDEELGYLAYDPDPELDAYMEGGAKEAAAGTNTDPVVNDDDGGTFLGRKWGSDPLDGS